MAEQVAAMDRLSQMLAEYRQSPGLYHPSPFWEELNAGHLDHLRSQGIENLKRSLATKYFNWTTLGILAFQFWPVMREWLRRPDRSVFSAEFPAYDQPRGKHIYTLNPLEAWFYKLYVSMLSHTVQPIDDWSLLQTIEEPIIGNPWRVKWNGQWVSQDLTNSIHEFYSIRETFNDRETTFDFAELGAGYGRLAYVFLKALPNATYTIIDIPPALYVSQEYLTRIFPNEKIFAFRPFDNFEDVRAEFESSRLRFLMAHQIELLPEKSFDVFQTISTLHEMTQEQIACYLDHMSRLTRRSVYTKQWYESRAGDKNGFTIKHGEYPIPADWSQRWHRTHPVQRWFFEALYDVK